MRRRSNSNPDVSQEKPAIRRRSNSLTRGSSNRPDVDTVRLPSRLTDFPLTSEPRSLSAAGTVIIPPPILTGEPPMIRKTFADHVTTCVSNYLFARYTLYNQEGDQQIADKQFTAALEKVFLMDKKFKEMDDEIIKLRDVNKTEEKKIAHQKLKNDNLEKNIDARQQKISVFYYNQWVNRDKDNDEIAKLRERKRQLDEVITQKRASNVVLQLAIEEQVGTVKEKDVMVKRIARLKEMIKKREERVETLREIKIKYMRKLTAVKSEVQTEVMRLNTTSEELRFKEPSLSRIYLRETNVESVDFQTVIETVKMNIKLFSNSFRNQTTKAKSAIYDMEASMASLVQQGVFCTNNLQALARENLELISKIEEWTKKKNDMVSDRQRERQKFEENKKLVIELQGYIKKFLIKLPKKIEQKKQRQAKFDLKVENVSNFFLNMGYIIQFCLTEMTNVFSQLFQLIQQKIAKIQDMEDEILEKLRPSDPQE